MKKGLIMRSTGSWYDVRTEGENTIQCRIRGKFKIAGMKVTNPLAVGDRVLYELENTEQNTGMINEILPRTNYIIRQSVHKTAHGHILAANIDQAILVVTLALPKTSLGFIDRFLVAAESFRIPTVLIFNKLDVLSPEGIEYQEELATLYKALGYDSIVTSAENRIGINAFKLILKDKVSLLAGHSGVGKSSLLNIIAPGLDLATTEISDFSSKGVHTTTFAEMFEISPNTFIIDSPGIKELGLADMAKTEISHYFPEMRVLLGACRFHNCQHINEPACAIKAAVEAGTIAESRYQNYLSMVVGEDNRR